MISIIKDLFSNQVGSAVILTIIGAITKKYIQFHRRDFFFHAHPPSSESPQV